MKLLFRLASITDYIGISSASLCLVHCIASPILLASGAYFIEEPWLKYVFIITAFFSIYFSLKEQTNSKVVFLLWAGFLLFLFSLLFEKAFPVLEYVSWVASLIIISGHIWNIKTCPKCAATEKDNLKSL
ncbi:MAG TPA: MerC domain-containing protein [Lacibacter sp.]|nr:MerC domain-containing protein [Lacibacter sp.]HMO87946.1 MerC domain-containing protein [Lacibacter sp.]